MIFSFDRAIDRSVAGSEARGSRSSLAQQQQWTQIMAGTVSTEASPSVPYFFNPPPHGYRIGKGIGLCDETDNNKGKMDRMLGRRV